MSDSIGAPLDVLKGVGGLTHHQLVPLRRHGVETVEQLADLVDGHRDNPGGSELSTVENFGVRRIELACQAIDQWRATAKEPK
ncbi:hypothetical protein [Amycolatopsis sp. TNS106]|uniref:hypothetical protein n=1 Tax=Amycolatopsis sp. TNS106 TaxID=2861750 RepID=UPI001C581EC6|nr:hypothetical protein [Amycolatopsis sp. TNS106]QXV57419.1 hypothetical protein CVV72_10740 [Amycolatopsis sp. TNS106]